MTDDEKLAIKTKLVRLLRGYPSLMGKALKDLESLIDAYLGAVDSIRFDAVVKAIERIASGETEVGRSYPATAAELGTEARTVAGQLDYLDWKETHVFVESGTPEWKALEEAFKAQDRIIQAHQLQRGTGWFFEKAEVRALAPRITELRKLEAPAHMRAMAERIAAIPSGMQKVEGA